MDELLESAPKTIVARAEADGFYARLYPQPDIRWPVVGGGAALWLGMAGALAWAMGRGDPVLGRLLFGALGIFGMLLYAFHHGRAFFPVEVSAARGIVFFAGERLPVALVSGCAVREEALVLRGADGAERGRIDHLPGSATEWVHRAMDLYLSSTADGRSSPPSASKESP